MLDGLQPPGGILAPGRLVAELGGERRQVATVLPPMLAIATILGLVLHCVGCRPPLQQVVLQTISAELARIRSAALHLLRILLVLTRSCLLLLNAQR